jgi:hypothetical protein
MYFSLGSHNTINQRMKKIFTLALAFVSLVAFAQNKQHLNGNHQRKISPRAATADEIRIAQESGSQDAAHSRGGTSFFTEDFANGLAGNNTFGAWTHEDSGNNTIWMLATATSPGGFYSDPSEALNSTTKLNGWMIFDCDLFQGGEITANNPAEDVTGYLTSPSIDLSTTTSVLLEFQQTFRYCCFDSKPVVVEVSNDGGTTWFQFDAAPTFTGGANDAAANPLTTVIDISGVATGESNVIIRWGWQPNGTQTHSHYYWGIDDIAIYENPVADDITVNYVTRGDIFNDFEYYAIPLEQANPANLGGMIVGTIYQNVGTNSQDATITAEILDANNIVLNTSSQTLTIPSNAELLNPGDPIDTLYINTNWVPTAIGSYSVRTTVSYGATDETPLDNVMTRPFEITSCEYGHDNPAIISGGMMEPLAGAGTAADPFSPTGYGSYYTFPNGGSEAHGLSIRFASPTDTNTPITLVLYQRNDDYNLTDADFIAGAEYNVINIWTPNGAQSFPYYLPFDESATLQSGASYFAGVQTADEGILELAVQAVVEDDVDASTGLWAETTEGTFIWFFGLGSQTDFSPAVRLVLCQYVSVEEAPAQVGLNSFNVSPNPATNDAKIGFNLSGSRFIAYEVRDMSGRLVDWKNMGQFSPGQQSFTLDVNNYPSGIYSVNLVIDGVHLFTQQMSIVK